MPRLRIVFRKGEEARYLSHLDLLATLEFAMRRARLPVELSEGFNPRPRMSLASPLSVGYVGEREILEIGLRESLPADEVQARLQATLPAGITIVSVHTLPPGARPAAARLRSATYRAALAHPEPRLTERIEALLAAPRLEIEEERDGKRRTLDVRPQILALEAPEGGDELRLCAALDGGAVRPDHILRLLGIAPEGVRIVRERIEIDREEPQC